MDNFHLDFRDEEERVGALISVIHQMVGGILIVHGEKIYCNCKNCEI